MRKTIVSISIEPALYERVLNKFPNVYFSSIVCGLLENHLKKIEDQEKPKPEPSEEEKHYQEVRAKSEQAAEVWRQEKFAEQNKRQQEISLCEWQISKYEAVMNDREWQDGKPQAVIEREMKRLQDLIDDFKARINSLKQT